MARITTHAVQRYIERFEPRLSQEQARDVLVASSRAIDVAAAFGATMVKLSNGARLVLVGDVVTTVKQSSNRMRTPASRVMRKGWDKARQQRRALAAAE